MAWDMNLSLAHGRRALWEAIRDGDAAACPCCGQLAKVYKRTIYSTLARNLIKAYRTAGADWFHGPTTVGAGGDFAKLAYWHLIYEADETRPDGGRAGWWRITATGEAFIRGEIRVPKYARVYDHRKLSLEGPTVDIKDCLGSRFDYQELMNA
jgi:hypothetical protein